MRTTNRQSENCYKRGRALRQTKVLTLVVLGPADDYAGTNTQKVIGGKKPNKNISNNHNNTKDDDTRLVHNPFLARVHFAPV